MNIEQTKNALQNLVVKINLETNNHIIFHQQSKVKKHMAIKGGNDGTIWIAPTSKGFDIALRGISLERNMYGFMRQMTNKEHDKYGYPREKSAPKWEVSDFNMIIKAVYYYAGITV